MKKRFYILILAILNTFGAFSQTVLSGNLYQENHYFLNPAYTGSSEMLSALLSYRQTSASLTGAPTLFGFGINSPIYRNMSLGARLFKQSEGLFDNLSGFVDYSYRIKLKKDQYLSFGISAGVVSNQLDYSKIVAEDPSAIIDVASRNYVGKFFQSAAGIVYAWDNLEVSFCVPRLFETKKTINPDYSTYISYKFAGKGQNISIRPSFLVTYNPNKPVLYDVNLTTFWKDQFFVGAAYRNSPAAIFSAGYAFKNISLSYAVEIGLQKQSNIFNKVHEISLSYSFRKIKPVRIDTINKPTDTLLALKRNLPSDTAMKISPNVDEKLSDDGRINLTDNPGYKVSKDKSIIMKYDETVEVHEISQISDTTSNKTNLKKNDQNIDVDDYDVVDIGNGLYSVKPKKDKKDSFGNALILSNKLVDSASFVDELVNRIEKDNVKNQTDIDNQTAYFYSIQLFVDQSNDYILRDAEIAFNTWFETDKNNKFIYYYGHFKSMEEAQNNLTKFEKYKDLVTKILKLQIRK